MLIDSCTSEERTVSASHGGCRRQKEPGPPLWRDDGKSHTRNPQKAGTCVARAKARHDGDATQGVRGKELMLVNQYWTLRSF